MDIIRNNIKVLNLINVHLSKSLSNADVNKSKCLFDELCNADITIRFKFRIRIRIT